MAMIRAEVEPGAMLNAANYLERPAEEYVNDANVEAMWAVKTVENAEIHYNLICSADPRILKLTKHDDWIYSKFKSRFPHFKVGLIAEEDLKSPRAKEHWRTFCEEMSTLEDYSFGTLLRLNCKGEYTEENTILVTRVQYLAIEIARNREGYNDFVYRKALLKKKANPQS